MFFRPHIEAGHDYYYKKGPIIYVHRLCDRNTGLQPASNGHFTVSPERGSHLLHSAGSHYIILFTSRKETRFYAKFFFQLTRNWTNSLPLVNQLQARNCTAISMAKQNGLRWTGKVRLDVRYGRFVKYTKSRINSDENYAWYLDCKH